MAVKHKTIMAILALAAAGIIGAETDNALSAGRNMPISSGYVHSLDTTITKEAAQYEKDRQSFNDCAGNNRSDSSRTVCLPDNKRYEENAAVSAATGKWK